jgi:hypothetical protein
LGNTGTGFRQLRAFEMVEGREAELIGTATGRPSGCCTAVHRRNAAGRCL